MTRFLLPLFLLLYGTAPAQWTTDLDANTPVRTMASGEAASPMVADGPEGSTYISWFENGTGNYQLRMQRLDADGVGLWDADGLVVSSHPQNTAIFRYDLQPDGAGNVIVAFQDERNGSLDVVAYKMGPDGTFLWGADGVELPTPGSTGMSPRAAALSNGNTVFAWRTGHDPARIAFQLVDPAGNTLLSPAHMVIYENQVSRPVPIASADGDFILQFELEGGSFLAPSTMYALRFDQSGNMIWPLPVQVSSKTVSGFYFPQPVSDGHGGFYLAFNTSNPSNFGLTDVYVQRVRANGTIWSTEGTRLDESNSTHKFTAGKGLAVVGDASGLMVPLQITNGGQSESGVFVQRVDTAGNLPWGADARVIIPIGSEQFSPVDIAATGDGAVIVHSSSTGFNQDQLAATRVDLDGSAVWSVPQRGVSTLLSGKGKVGISSTRAGQAVVVWQDNRNPPGIYAQNIPDLDGTTGILGFANGQSGLRLEQNPAMQPTLLSDASPVARTLQVYDLDGRLVHAGSIGAWATRTELPLGHLANGVYSIRVQQAGYPASLRWVK